MSQAGRDLGKQIEVSTEVPTPSGWTTMGDLTEGDVIFGSDGQPTTVVKAYEPMVMDTYDVVFDTGETITAGGDHLWDVIPKGSPQHGEAVTMSTRDMAKQVYVGKEANYQIPVTGSLELPEADLPIHPWVLGYWLGNGSTGESTVTVGRHDQAAICSLFEKFGHPLEALGLGGFTITDPEDRPGLRGFCAKASELGVLDDKHVPAAYLRASHEQRLLLLQGLMDSDGHTTKKDGRCENTQKRKALADAIHELACSLGQKPFRAEKTARIYGEEYRTVYTIGWAPRLYPMFLNPRRQANVKPAYDSRVGRRRIVAINEVEPQLARCIDVDASDHLYLVGRSMIPTHNSRGLVAMAVVWPWCFPGQDLLITAPQLNHLRPVCDSIEDQLYKSPLLKAMLPLGGARGHRSTGINRQPSFTVSFINGSKILTRLPGLAGTGVKGMHATRIELDECFPAGTLVLTKRGQVPIEDVRVGDEVWTHMNRWRPVTHTFDRGVREAIKLEGQGHPGLVCTPDHEFWACPVTGWKDRRSQWGPVFKGGAEWVAASELPNSAWWTSPVAVQCEPPEDSPELTEDFMALAGWWMTQGSPTSHGALILSVHDKWVPEVTGLLGRLGLEWSEYRVGERCVNVTGRVRSSRALVDFLKREFGHGAHNKRVPTWVLGLPETHRRAFLEAAVSGDGWWHKEGQWKFSTVSKASAVGMRLLGLSLGQHTSVHLAHHSGPRSIRGREIKPSSWYSVTGRERGQVRFADGFAYSKVKKATPVEPQRMYDLTVADDHSFVADGINVSNSQNYPEQGFVEIIESMKAATKNSRWRMHGVPSGDRNFFYKASTGENPDMPFTVHRYMAMHRPTWSDEERKAKIAMYGGSSMAIDYQRNIYGEHGSTNSALLVRSRLNAVIRKSESPWAVKYNDQIYHVVKIDPEIVAGGDIKSFLDSIPENHFSNEYGAYFAGVDLGFTQDPTEVLVWGMTERRGKLLMRQLLRVQMQRISAPDQALVFDRIIEMYGDRLKAFGMDATGIGLPVWQAIVNDDSVPRERREKIHGFNFSRKEPVAFEDRDPVGKETLDDLVIYQDVVTWGYNELRRVVDEGEVELPFDVEQITEYQGQTIKTVKDPKSGSLLRRSGSKSSLHTVDATLMLLAGWKISPMRALLDKPDTWEPVIDVFL